ncbi:hypothetical protein FGO68_gene4819 [Halteria grandinella]|uniref:Uncharacterized protein n=1 Tax=Halteria grandinella TaxID=5974 RepID=A0A8J8NTF5_HALGN|nr:hypothetical protein FGO68_gene4819 [Halteria grandinella]
MLIDSWQMLAVVIIIIISDHYVRLRDLLVIIRLKHLTQFQPHFYSTHVNSAPSSLSFTPIRLSRARFVY